MGCRPLQSLGITRSSPWRLAGMCPHAPRATPCPPVDVPTSLCRRQSLESNLESNPSPPRSQPTCPRAGFNPNKMDKPSRCPAAAGERQQRTNPGSPFPGKCGLLVGEAEERWKRSLHPPAFPTLEGIRAPHFSLQRAPAALGWPQSAALISWSCRGIHREYFPHSEGPGGSTGREEQPPAPRTCLY